MIARFTTIPTALESDVEFFLDHRRQFRWRPRPGDSDASIIIKRDGERLSIPVPPNPGLWDAGDDVLGALHAAYLTKKAERNEAPGQ